MDHYIDIKVLPDPEFKETILMSALFAKLHRHIGLVAQGEIALSFPGHGKTLGAVMRVHATKPHLEKLQTLNWLKGLRDYTECKEITAVPQDCQYRTVSRVQAKSVYNKRKRSISKGWLTPELAVEKIPDGQQRELTQPFAQVSSLSNGNPMKVHVEHGKITDTPVDGTFSSYGLSSTSTIPWF